MRKNIRTFLSVAITFCMVVSLVLNPAGPAGVKEVRAETYEDFEYEALTDTEAAITKYTGSDAKPRIPEKIGDLTVTQIGSEAFKACTDLTGIIIPGSVTSIGMHAFYGCTSLADIVIPSSVASIGTYAFYNCTSLKDIILPSSITSIGTYAFYGCTGLASIDIPNGVTGIDMLVFGNCESLASVTIPNSVTSIGFQAFYHCTGLTDVTIPDSVTAIDFQAFCGCTGLTDLSIPSSITRIGKGVFYGCTGLKNVTIPNSVTSIGETAFYHCTGLTDVTIPNSVTNIGYQAFDGCTGLKNITLPGSVTSLGEYAFSGCTGLTDAVIPDSVASMENGIFYNCSSLVNVTMATGVMSIGSSVFSHCTGLTSISIPNSVTSIGDFAFSDCAGLTDFTIPDSVTRIGVAAFEGCSSLQDIFYSGVEGQWKNINIDSRNERLTSATIHCEKAGAKDYEYKKLEDGTVAITKYNGSDTEVKIPAELNWMRVVKICTGAFNNDRIENITIPSGVQDVEERAIYGCSNLTNIYVERENEKFASEDGILFNKTMTELVRYPEGRSGTYVVPDKIVRIGASAFAACKNLTDVTIQDGVTQIGEWAFENCDELKKIAMPVSVSRIYSSAFVPGNSNALEDVYYGGTKEQWEQIDVLGASDDDKTVSEKLGITATIHFKEEPIVPSEETVLPEVSDTKQELEQIKSDKPLSLDADFGNYMSPVQINTIKSYLYTWLAEINYAYRYPDNDSSHAVKERIMKKAGIDPNGNFASGTEQAITHISVETKYGSKVFEFTMDLGKPDGSGNLYSAYGALHYEVLDKGNIPSDVPSGGEIGKASGIELESYIKSVSSATENSLCNTYLWESMRHEQTAGVLTDKTVTEIIGNKNGSFSGGVFTVYEKPLDTYSKKVTISGSADVQVYIYNMNGNVVASIIDNKPVLADGTVASVINDKTVLADADTRLKADPDIWMEVDRDTNEKIIYLSGKDYYVKLCGTGVTTAGTRAVQASEMTYTVEEVANDEVRRTVQFLELQLLNDMQYEGYVFRPLNIDRDLYALRMQSGSGQDVVYANEDSYQSLFKMVQGLSISQEKTSLKLKNTIQLNASIYPLDASNPNLQWKSDNDSVVTVDKNGLVTAVGAGSATITVLTKDGSFLKQFCIFDVSGSSGGGSSSGSFGGSSGGMTGPFVEQETLPVVENLHFILQFDLNGGTSLSRKTMTLLADDVPGIMPKAKRKDYIFIGWYTQQDGGTRVSGDKPMSESATLYARWTKAEAPANIPVMTLQSNKKGKIQVSFQEISGADGYQMEYSDSKKFESVKTKEAKASAKAKTISGLKAGKKYFVRMRAYSVDSMGNKFYGAYSGIKSIKAKA